MLYTNLAHIESANELLRIISENTNVMIICGRMGPMCVPMYHLAEVIQDQYSHVKFYDMEFDNPESVVIRNLQEVKDFMSIPFAVYYKNGKVVKATSGIQTNEQIKTILDKEFVVTVNV